MKLLQDAEQSSSWEVNHMVEVEFLNDEVERSKDKARGRGV